MIFEPFTIKNVTFKNRILRSSMGGRTSYYDGTVTSAWKHFEKRFAEGGIAGIISATIDVDDSRLSPLEYPKISDDRFIKPMREGVREVQMLGCRYIMQIGDAGGQTQMSLFSQEADAKSASKNFDLLFGYRNRTVEMTLAEIEEEIQKFADAARRVREIGCDGVEVTASKGYMIHQFLNPLTNRRTDEYGGTIEKRFRLLKEIVTAVRKKIGDDYLFGIRLSAVDYNYLPLNVRLPVVFPLRHWYMGNTLEETLGYGTELEKLGIDYLHIDSGFGFLNPKGNPGEFPYDSIKLFLNYTRHLSGKARFRAALVNLVPPPLAKLLFGIGWKYVPGANAEFAQKFKGAVKIPVISNGGFQQQDHIEETLQTGKCDMVAIARPLLANPDLLKQFAAGKNEPDNPCTFCNRCCTRTAVLPLGCYDQTRFASQDEMEQQIIAWSGTPELYPTA
jgi:2,4-dienoyl-CoA reductase-like NADH-dependent reductase (Old Yellow Enzyme family)